MIKHISKRIKRNPEGFKEGCSIYSEILIPVAGCTLGGLFGPVGVFLGCVVEEWLVDILYHYVNRFRSVCF